MKKVIFLLFLSIFLTGCLKQNGGVNKSESKVEEFTGNLKEAMMKNAPLKCEWQNNENSGESYVKGKNMYVTTKTQGKKSYMIRKNDCIWTWDETKDEGLKICEMEEAFEADEEEAEDWQPDQGGYKAEGVDWKMEYKCRPGVFGEEKFEIPSKVKFMDMQEMMQGMMEGVPGAVESN